MQILLGGLNSSSLLQQRPIGYNIQGSRLLLFFFLYLIKNFSYLNIEQLSDLIKMLEGIEPGTPRSENFPLNPKTDLLKSLKFRKV